MRMRKEIAHCGGREAFYAGAVAAALVVGLLGLTGVARADHARPQSAGVLVDGLVPSYRQCLGSSPPGMVHGAPLAVPSCGPPAQSSELLTVGTGDSNGQPTNSSGRVTMKVLPGNPDSPPEEADVSITVVITDVRTRGTLTDYLGEVTFFSLLRVTGHPTGAPSASTAVDVPLTFPVPCTPTEETSIGSRCEVTTSADAVLPGIAVEGNRASWEMEQPQVLDPASLPFHVQGTYLP